MTSRRRGRGRGGRQTRLRSTVSFWGSAELLPAQRGMPDSDDPTAVVRSLGPPPLPAHEAIAEHYFDAVYERASTLAAAIAAAGGLIRLEELQPDE